MSSILKLPLASSQRFEIRRQLGTGGMGVVYEAFDRERQSRVALKTLRHLDAHALYRFKNEFRAIQGLQHRNLARLDELIEYEGEWFYTMEYIDGVDLLDYVQPGAARRSDPSIAFDPTDLSGVISVMRVADDHKRMTVAHATTVTGRSARDLYDEARLRSSMRQLAEAIHALHQTGKVHRDIKPSNVLVDRDGRVVLIDFGLVTDVSNPDSMSGQRLAGTAAYMAPEQALARATAASDWYSFGLVLYEALVGTKPYRGQVVEILMDKQQFEPPRPSLLVPDTPTDLDTLCAELVRVDPHTRPKASRILARLGVADSSAVPPPTTLSTSGPPSLAAPFVGRDEELARLEQAFEDSCDNGPVLTFLHGASGVGKTELVHRFCERLAARRPDVLLLQSRCYERESVPYKAFDGIADRLSRHLNSLDMVSATELLPLRASLLPQLFPILRRVEAIATAPIPRIKLDPQELRARMFWAFRELFQKLTYRHPVVLCIDDFQFADADSLNLLAELVQAPDAPLLLMIATMRTRSGLQPVLSEMERVAGVEIRHMRIGRLAPADAEALAARLLPELDEAGAELVQRIAREADGHPLFIQELSRHVDLREPGNHQLARLNDALWARISRLSPGARRVLQLVAVAGSPITLQTLAYAARIPPPQLASTIALLRVAFLARTTGAREADSIELYHDRVRDAVLFQIEPAELIHLHERLAIALDRSGAAEKDPHILVRHMEAAGQPERALSHAIDGARMAVEALAFDRAVDLYRTAVRLAPRDSDEQRALQIDLGRALIYGGRSHEGAYVLLAAAEGANSELRIACLRQATEQLLISGHVDRGLEVLRQLLAEVGGALPATPRRALLSVLWNRLRLRLRGLHWTERTPNDIPATHLARVDAFESAAVGLTMVDAVRAADFQTRALRLALDAGEPLRVGRAIAQEAGFLATIDARGRRRAAAMLAEPLRLALRNEDPYLLGCVRESEGVIGYFAGDFSVARAALQEAEELMVEQTVGTAWEVGTSRVFQFFIARLQGSFQELRSITGPFLRDAHRRGDLYTEATMRRVLTPLYLADGQPEAARADLKAISFPLPQNGFHLQHWYQLEAEGELALYAGTAATALPELAPTFVELERSQILRVQMVRALADWLRARLLLATAATAGSPKPLLRRARRLARRMAREKVPYAAVWACLIEAALAAQRGAVVDATRWLRDAGDRADRAGMASCAAAAQHRLAQLLGPGGGSHARSAAQAYCDEQEIADPERFLATLAPGFPADAEPPDDPDHGLSPAG